MKLCLTSYRIPQPEHLLKLIDKPANETKLAVIPNAKDYYADRARAVKIKESQDYLSALGFNPQTVDLRSYRDTKKLKKELERYDAIWVMGGNTFCLRYEMRESGFDQLLPQLLESGIVYVGESAGACVLSPSLSGLEQEDEPLFSEDIIWEGLGIVDKFILPHADNPWMQDSINYARSKHSLSETLELKDSEMHIVNGEKAETIHAAP